MKTLILKSNHGNHTGFNRTWEVLTECDSSDINIELSKIMDNIADKYNLTDEQVEDIYSANGFEYDLYYYTTVTQDEYDNVIFDGGHMGYANKEIANYFKSDFLVEIEKGLDWNDGYLGYGNNVVEDYKHAQCFESNEDAEDAAASFNIQYGRNGRIYARVI